MTFPRTIDELNTGWLTSVLGAEVASYTSERIGEGIGTLGELHRVVLTYGDSGGPESVVIKLPTSEELGRFIADAMGYYQREVRFYSEIAGDAVLGTAHCYHSEIATDSTDFVLVLEDMSGSEPADQVAGMSVDQVMATVRAIGGHHARWWQDDRLTGLSDTFLPINSEIYTMVLPDLFSNAWTTAFGEMGSHIPDAETAAFADRYVAQIPWMLKRMDQPSTLVHGDLRADNLFFDASGVPSAIDFQITGLGVGAYDCAYLLSQSVSVEVRREHEQDFLAAYHQALLDGGVDDYSFEQLWDDYRVCLAFCLIYPVTNYDRLDELANARGRELIDAMFVRSVTAIADTRAHELIPE